MTDSLLLQDPRFLAHRPPGRGHGYHPERPERLDAARTAIERCRTDFDISFMEVAPRAATDEELARVHHPEFIEGLRKLRGRDAFIDADTFVSPESIATAELAAGGCVAMVDALIDGDVKRGVAMVRPPGHHATPGRAMGFCLFNNVAIAAAHARARGLSRVAVIDWDVHHGNGTQDAFYRDPSVLYVSTHQYPFYPGTGAVRETGEGDGKGYTVNVPLSLGGGDAVYRAAFDRVILPALSDYAPELVLVSAGFDASARDPLAEMTLSSDGFGWMARELAKIADRSAQGRIAMVLEGGYDLVALESGIVSATRGLIRSVAADLPRSPDHADISRASQVAKETFKSVDT